MEKEASKGLIIAGYIFAVLVCFIGLLIGVILISKTRNSNGETGYTYNEKSRNHGKKMIPIAIIVAVVFLASQWM